MINSNKCMSSRWNSIYHPYVKNSIFVIYLNPSPAPENYYNLSLIFEKIGFPFSSDQNIKFVADYKLRQAKKNITYFEDIILVWIPFSNLIYFSIEIRTLGRMLNIDNQTDVIS